MFEVAHVKLTRAIVAPVALFVLLALLSLDQVRVIAVVVGRNVVLFDVTFHSTMILL